MNNAVAAVSILLNPHAHQPILCLQLHEEFRRGSAAELAAEMQSGSCKVILPYQNQYMRGNPLHGQHFSFAYAAR